MPDSAPCLEAQIVDFADEVAYNAHDVDDGLKSGMLHVDDLRGVSLWNEAEQAVARVAPAASEHVRWYQSIRTMIDELVNDLVATLHDRLRLEGIARIEDVRRVKPRLVELSPAMTERNLELKAFGDRPPRPRRTRSRPRTRLATASSSVTGPPAWQDRPRAPRPGAARPTSPASPATPRTSTGRVVPGPPGHHRRGDAEGLSRGRCRTAGRLTPAERNADDTVLAARAAVADLAGRRARGRGVVGRSMTQLTFDISRAMAKDWEPG